MTNTPAQCTHSFPLDIIDAPLHLFRSHQSRACEACAARLSKDRRRANCRRRQALKYSRDHPRSSTPSPQPPPSSATSATSPLDADSVVIPLPCGSTRILSSRELSLPLSEFKRAIQDLSSDDQKEAAAERRRFQKRIYARRRQEQEQTQAPAPSTPAAAAAAADSPAAELLLSDYAQFASWLQSRPEEEHAQLKRERRKAQSREYARVLRWVRAGKK